MVGIKLTPHTMSSIEMGIPDDAGDTQKVLVPAFLADPDPDTADTVEVFPPAFAEEGDLPTIEQEPFDVQFRKRAIEIFKERGWKSAIESSEFLKLRRDYEEILGCAAVFEIIDELSVKDLN